jgi:hypothetical protein
MKKKKLSIKTIQKLIEKYELEGSVSGGGDDGCYNVNFNNKIEEKDKEKMDFIINRIQEYLCYNIGVSFDGNVSVSGDIFFKYDDENIPGIEVMINETSSEDGPIVGNIKIPVNLIPFDLKFDGIEINKYAYEDGIHVNISTFEDSLLSDVFEEELEDYLNENIDINEGEIIYEYISYLNIINKEFIEIDISAETEENFYHFLPLKDIFSDE